MTLLLLLTFVAGVVALVAGAEALVRGASRLALGLGLSPLVVGLTVVAYGTSAPELATTVGAALSGSADIGLGNVVGSNIANVLLILGLSAVVAPLVVSRQLVWIDVPVMLGVSLVVVALAFDGRVSRLDGVLLVAAGIAYTVMQLRLGRREARAAAGDDTPTAPRTPPWRDVAWVLAGLGLLVLGAGWLVDAAVEIAKWAGISELVIGLTVVAIGTSLPELATSVLATLRGQRDIAVGNIVGSNIFNLLLVLGGASIIAPGGVGVGDAALRFDLPVMTAVALACLPIFFTGHCIARWEGALFVGYYVAYVAYLLLDAAGHDALPAFSMAMMAFVVPLTVVTLLVVATRAWRSGHR